MSNRFLVFEGLSASGKTTIARQVAREIGAVFYKTPSRKFRAIRELVDRRADILGRFFFYLAGVCDASAEIKKKLSSRPVVCDRYLLTTICFHAAVGLPTDQLANGVSSRIIVPDFTFLLVCEEGVRLRRLAKRGLTFNDKQERQRGLESRFLAEYRRHILVEIDNSSPNPRDAVGIVLQKLQQ